MKKIKDNLDWNDYDKIENLGIQFMTIGMKSKSVDFTSPLEETQYRNTLNMPEIPNDWIYKRQIKNMYQYNSDGFRNNFDLDDIDWSKCIAVFGCSNIFGKGVEQHHSICHYIQELTGLTAVNLGVEGASIRSTFNNAIYVLEKYYPKQMAIFWPGNNRISLTYKWDLNDNNWSHIDMTGVEKQIMLHENLEPDSFGLMHNKQIHVNMRDLWPTVDETHFIDNQDVIYQQNLYKQVLKTIARDRGMPLFEYSSARVKRPRVNALDQVEAEYPEHFAENFKYMGDYKNKKPGWHNLPDDHKNWWINRVCARDIGTFDTNGGPRAHHFGPVINKAIAKLILKNRIN